MNLSGLETWVEALLFASGEAISLTKIATAIDQDSATTKKIINELKDKYETEKRGMCIIEIEGSFQMCTNPSYYEILSKLFKAPTKKTLTDTLLETLSIISYKQPITKSQIEEIRGVNADHAINKLMEYNLVVEKGRQDSPGRPILFGTSEEFLRYFGLRSVKDLPSLNNLKDNLELTLD